MLNILVIQINYTAPYEIRKDAIDKKRQIDQNQKYQKSFEIGKKKTIGFQSETVSEVL